MSNKNTQQTNKSKTRKGTNKGGKNPPQKTKKPKKVSWHLFTSKQMAFSAAARNLDEVLKHSYGPSASISAFEMALQEVSVLTDPPAEFFVEEGIFELYEEYLRAKTARQEESNSFRSEQTIQSVASAFQSVRAKLAGEPENDEKEEST